MPTSLTDELPSHHVRRRRLIEAMRAAPVVVLEAPGGFGKTSLAAEFATELGVATAVATVARGTDSADLAVAGLVVAVRDAGLSDLAAPATAAGDDPVQRLDALLEAVGRLGDPLLLVVDDVHRASGPAVDVLGDLAERLPGGHRLLLLARELPAGLRPPPGAVVLDAAALALTDDETASLVEAALGRAPSGDEVERVGRTSAGWPAAAVLAATALGRGRVDAAPARPLDALVETLVGAESLDDAVALAALPLVDDVVAGLALGPAGLQRLDRGRAPPVAGRQGLAGAPGCRARRAPHAG